MATWLRRRSVDRRMFLRGAGAALALPLLDAMRPALAAGAAPPKRFMAVCAMLGFHTPFLVPAEAGLDYTPSPYLDALKAHRKKLTVFSGLSHAEQAGANGHTSEMTWLTAARRPGLPGFKNTVSLDQFIAAKIGLETRHPSLQLCTSGSDSLSWSANGVPIPAEQSPAKVFALLFIDGTPQQLREQTKALRRGQSVLDTVAAEARKLERDVGPADKHKLDEYFTAVRDMEGRLKESEAWAGKPKPKVDAKQPTDVQNRLDTIAKTDLLHDMAALAFSTDSTRTITLRINGLNAVPVVDGVSNDWHNLSHHGQDTAKIDELRKIELAEFRSFGRFLAKLESIREGDATLLDGVAVLYGSNLGNASAHDTRNLPLVLAGGGFKHAGHLAYDSKNNPAFSNLFVTLARRMGVEADKFGASTAAGVAGFA